jgi:hypothetical protein
VATPLAAQARSIGSSEVREDALILVVNFAEELRSQARRK